MDLRGFYVATVKLGCTGDRRGGGGWGVGKGGLEEGGGPTYGVVRVSRPSTRGCRHRTRTECFIPA